MTSGIYIAEFNRFSIKLIISPCRIIFNKQKTNIFMLKRYLTENHAGQGLAPAEKNRTDAGQGLAPAGKTERASPFPTGFMLKNRAPLSNLHPLRVATQPTAPYPVEALP